MPMLRAWFFVFFSPVFVLMGAVFFVPTPHAMAQSVPSVCTSDIDGKTDVELTELLKKCEEEIDRQKRLLGVTKEMSASLARTVKEFEQRIKKAQLEINARAVSIKRLSGDIKTKDQRISELTERLERVQVTTAELVRETNELSNRTPVEAFLSGEDLSEFFSDIDRYAEVKGNLSAAFIEARGIKELVQSEKQTLEEKKNEEQRLKFEQEQEKRKSENYKAEKERVLVVSRGQEVLFQKDIAEKERIKNEIRNRIFRTVGGGELRFEDAVKLVTLYEGKIGVDAALTLAVLSQESSVDGLIGRNIGKCTYNQTATNRDGTVMSKSQHASFLAILTELGMNPNNTPVSCPIYSDGSFGGAMGPAQFMPNTWWNVEEGTGYKQRIAKILGITSPSPFSNLDAFTGTALYLSDAEERCRTAFSAKIELWSCTAAKYYSGLSTKGSRLAQHMRAPSSYGYQVAKRAEQFRKDIDLLDL